MDYPSFKTAVMIKSYLWVARVKVIRIKVGDREDRVMVSRHILVLVVVAGVRLTLISFSYNFHFESDF